jgi:RES domain
VTFRRYGPKARFDHQHPADPPVEDPTGRRVLYVGEDLATSACEVFGDAGIAAICPFYRVAIIAPTTTLAMFNLVAKGAAMAIGALPALGDGNEPRSLTQQWVRAIYEDKPAAPKSLVFITDRATTAVRRSRCGTAMATSKSCAITTAISKIPRSTIHESWRGCRYSCAAAKSTSRQ